MPDWKELVQERLSTLNLPVGAKEDVVAEVAAHLEDSQGGYPDTSESGNRALAGIEWHKLKRAIEDTKREEDAMNHRTKTLWLPAITILFAAGLVLLFLDRAAFLQKIIWLACMAMFLCTAGSEGNSLNQRTRRLWLPALQNLTLAMGLIILLDLLNLEEPGIATAGHIARAFRIPWLLVLPLSGAMGALLAKRAEASRAERLIAGLAPALVWLAVFGVMGTIFAFDRHDFSGFPTGDFAVSAVGLVIVPSVALFLGTAPFLREAPTQGSTDAFGQKY